MIQVLAIQEHHGRVAFDGALSIREEQRPDLLGVERRADSRGGLVKGVESVFRKPQVPRPDR